MSSIQDITHELSAIAASLRMSSEATLSERYAAARLAYLDNTVERLVDILEADGYHVQVGKHSGKRVLDVSESRQVGLFGGPGAPKAPFKVMLWWDDDMILWEQDRAAQEIGSGRVAALKNTPTASAKKVAGGLER